ncbi:MAG: C40 family peptidase [Nonlabens sp.]|uniref:C40 family peptidase n=1 Tax=Nonlabens sp. TaxID=1888209 RepID=UPI003EF407C9
MIFMNTLSRKRNSKTLIKRTIVAVFTSLLLLGNTSCKSSKPRIATTKKEAAKRYPSRTYKPSSSSNGTTVVKDKRTSSTPTTVENDKTTDAPFVKEVIETAMSYEGTRYKYGGSSKKGMDCSGLIHVSFLEAGKSVPRTSSSLFNAAKPVSFNKIEKGDLLFFATGKNKTRVNHVGLVVNTTAAEVSFIHASTSRGVMVSTMNEGYWLNAYLSAGRLD